MIINKYREQFTYLFFGVVTTFVNWGIFTLLIYLELPLVISNTVSWIAAVIVAFFTNKWWVFKSRNKGFKNVISEWFAFLGSRILTGILELGLVPILAQIGLDQVMFSTTGLDSKILVSIAVVIGNYFISKIWIFKASPSAEEAKLEGQ